MHAAARRTRIYRETYWYVGATGHFQNGHMVTRRIQMSLRAISSKDKRKGTCGGAISKKKLSVYCRGAIVNYVKGYEALAIITDIADRCGHCYIAARQTLQKMRLDSYRT